MQFSKDEWFLMMLYNPGSRAGLIKALTEMQSELTGRDRNLKKWTASVLEKLEKMSDAEFDELDLYPD
mgnify:CR=1 FL=1